MKSSDKAMLVSVSFLILYWRGLIFFNDFEFTKIYLQENSQTSLIVGGILALLVFLYVNSRSKSNDTVYDSDKIHRVSGDEES